MHLWKRLTALVILLVLLAVGQAGALGLFGTSNSGTIEVTEEEYALIEKYRRLETVYAIIDKLYLWEYDEQTLLDGAAQGMLGALDDDYSYYYTPDQMEQENEALAGEYGGLGIEVFPNLKDDTITIRRVFYGGPSQQAGLKPSDKIVGVNGEDMRASDINEAVKVMRGEIGEEVTLSILRDTEIFDVTVQRALVQTQIIQEEMLEGQIGYVRIFYFEGELMSQFSEAMSKMQAKGARGLILDVRENPGGLVDRATDLVDVFVGEEVILITEDKYGRQLTYYGREGVWDIPVVVLVDEYSASASEIVAAALQENGVAKVVGQQTFGKGIMQSVYPFTDDGAGMQITSDYWLTPKGNNLHEEGVTPDEVVELPEDAYDENFQLIREKDTQLHKAVDVLEEMIDERLAA